VKDDDACGDEKANVALEEAMRPLGPLSIAVSGAVGFAPGPSSPDGGVAARAIAAWPAIRKTARREIASRGLRRLIRARLSNALHHRDSARPRLVQQAAWEEIRMLAQLADASGFQGEVDGKGLRVPGTSKLASMALAVLAGLLVFSEAATAKPRPGDLDSSFGGNGVVRTHVDGLDGPADAVAVPAPPARRPTPGGRVRSKRIVVAGTTTGGFALARYQAHGGLDASFSGDGMRTVGFPNSTASASSVVLNKGGGVAVAGTACPRGGHCQVAVAKLTAGGRLDRGFGQDGRATVDFGTVQSGASSVAIDSRGRTVIAGTVCGPLHCDFGIARLNKDGELDPSFGNDGRVVARVDPGDRRAFTSLNAMAIDSRQRIIAAGNVSHGRVALVRYGKDGHRDRSFGHDGFAVRDLDRLGTINGIVVTPKDKIVAAGDYKPNGGAKVVLARFDRSGRLDHAFGKGGAVAADICGKENSFVYGVALDSKNRIVVTGKHNFTVARFQPNGNLNRSFGRNGRVTKDFDGAQARAVAIDSRDRPVVAGDGGTRFVVARFIG
jgi:uncharacterized delta-60 repeat protein